ncbi:MAG TPA: YihY/virulence factor BrkB family protein [Stellaceae bacterium]|nr:YihY/virulence factor BrkB family protein [Stellaceae bacterium]
MAVLPTHLVAVRDSNGFKPRLRTWREHLGRLWQCLTRNNISIMAAGCAFYTMLSIFPGMSALVLTYGLVSDPARIGQRVAELRGVLPVEALKLLSDRLHDLVTAPPQKLGIGLIVSLLIAIWSATSGTTAIMEALTVAYGDEERRGFVWYYVLALLLTIGLVVFGLASLLLIAVVPIVAGYLPLPHLLQALLPYARWVLLALFAVVGLGTLYRLAPDRRRPSWDFLRPGTIAASVLWLGASVGLSFYASYFGSYDRMYGSLGAVVVLLIWLYLTAYIILAGAELNAELERFAAPPAETPDEPEALT